MQTVGLSKLIYELYSRLSSGRRAAFISVGVLLVVASFAEVITIGAVVPVVAIMADPKSFYSSGVGGALVEFTGISNSPDLMILLAGLFIAVVFVSTALRLTLMWGSTKLIMSVAHDLSTELYGTVLQQEYDYHVHNNSAETVGSVGKLQILVDALLMPLTQAVVAFVISVSILLALIIIEPAGALYGGGLIASIYFLISAISRRNLRLNGQVIAAAQVLRVKDIQESLGSIRDIILDGSHKYYITRFSKTDADLRRAQGLNVIIGAAPRYIVEALVIAILVSLAYFVSISDSGLTSLLPSLGAMVLGVQRLMPQLQTVYTSWSRAMGNRQVLADVLELLRLDANIVQNEDDSIITFTKEMKLVRLGFTHRSNHSPIFSGISLTIKKGATLGLIGKTGSGKSTLVDLMMGLLSTSEGHMSIDGVKLEARNLRSWRKMISHVPQDIHLIDGSITENIALGVVQNEIDEIKVRQSATKAQILDFIESLDDGFDTMVGENGARLSGGQKQRIGIARALYRETPVLVLDEATSALDIETEQRVMTQLREVSKDLTLVIIAHRLETLSFCDEIIRLGETANVERLSYSELSSIADQSKPIFS